MEFLVTHSQLIIKVLFLIIIPAFVIYLKLKKKISTGFTVGVILTSFVTSLIVSATVLQLTYDDPVENFETLINLKKTEEARKALKVIVQYGPERVSMINEDKIIYRDTYEALKKDLISEYEVIAARYMREYAVARTEECSELNSLKKRLAKLKHARVLYGFSESLGSRNTPLKNRLDSEIGRGENILSILESQCR